MDCADGGEVWHATGLSWHMRRHAVPGLVFETAIRCCRRVVPVDISHNGMGVRELDDGPAVLELDADGAVG